MSCTFTTPCYKAPAQSQEGFGPDALFQQAREMGFAGKREEARHLCLKILEQYPDYTDVKILLGRLHAWDRQFDAARETFLEVLSKTPANIDARSALVDVELSSNRPGQALQYAEDGLRSQPGSETLLYKKVLALEKLGRLQDASGTARRILDVNPSNREVRAALDRLSRWASACSGRRNQSNGCREARTVTLRLQFPPAVAPRLLPEAATTAVTDHRRKLQTPTAARRAKGRRKGGRLSWVC